MIFAVWVAYEERKVPFENGRDPITNMAARRPSWILFSTLSEWNDFHCVRSLWVEEGSFRKWVRSDNQYGRQGSHLEFGFRSFRGERFVRMKLFSLCELLMRRGRFLSKMGVIQIPIWPQGRHLGFIFNFVRMKWFLLCELLMRRGSFLSKMGMIQ